MRKILLQAILLMIPILVMAKQPSINKLTNFATSPDKKLKLWTEAKCPTNTVCKVYYQKGNKLIKAMDLTFFNEPPSVTWYGNMANLSTISGTDATLNVFVDAKRGVFRVANMTQFDPKHECALGLDKTGENVAYYRLFQENPTTVLDVKKMEIDTSVYFPITTVAIGGDNGFLDNGDFQLDYFTSQNQRIKTVIKNPCQSIY